MTTEWRASAWGRLLTKSDPWRLSVEGDRLFLRLGEKDVEMQPDNLSSIDINRGVLWTNITLFEGQKIRIDGLPNAKQQALKNEVGRLLLITRRRKFDECHSTIRGWLDNVAQTVIAANSENHWLTHEMQQALLANKPMLSIDDNALTKLFQTPEVQSSLQERAAATQRDLGPRYGLNVIINT